jgi:hypothetical protein
MAMPPFHRQWSLFAAILERPPRPDLTSFSKG